MVMTKVLGLQEEGIIPDDRGVPLKPVRYIEGLQPVNSRRPVPPMKNNWDAAESIFRGVYGSGSSPMTMMTASCNLCSLLRSRWCFLQVLQALVFRMNRRAALAGLGVQYADAPVVPCVLPSVRAQAP